MTTKGCATVRFMQETWATVVLCLACLVTAPNMALAQPPASPPSSASAQTPALPQGLVVPADYIIGPGDVLAVAFWREKDISVEEVVVRPDGMITLPVINDVAAGGLTPEQLRVSVEKAAGRYVETPAATVIVKQINSRRFFITGMINKPGAYGLGGPLTVLQAIALAGGVSDFAKKNDIVVMRTVGGKTQTLKFRYKDVIKGKNLEQNIFLRPGDTIIVP